MVRRMTWLAATAAVASVLAAPVARAQLKRPYAVGSKGAAASVDPLATAAAVDVMRNGGNAFDAAIAAAGVLGVVEPYSCGIGGGGFMVIRDGKTGKITTIDSREKAPAAMQPNSFFLNGKAPDDSDATFRTLRYSGLSVGVPGTPYAWSYVLRHYGTYSLQRALRYGEVVARQGFRVDQTFFDQTTPNDAWFDDIPSTAALYLDPDGTPRDVGTTIRNPDLAKTYERLGRLGVKKGFYTGPVADAMVAATQRPPVSATAEHTWRPGLMTARDLQDYTVKVREPVHLKYFGYDVYGMGPPSSGGSTTLEALNIIQQLNKARPLASRLDILYAYLEASRLAWADRNKYLGDPAFNPSLPLTGLLSDDYAAQRAALIGPQAPRGTVQPGTPPPNPPAAGSANIERTGSTTHLSVADAAGNIVAYTFTIEQTGGNGVVVPSYGFLLNNELTDFDYSSTTAANRPEGRKRPRSSIDPLILLKNGKPWLTVGSPGGASIITTGLQTLVNRINLHMTLPDAVAAPRASQRNSSTTEVEPEWLTSRDGQLLQSVYGEAYRVAVGGRSGGRIDQEIGAATGIEFRSGHRLGAVAEPVRRGGGSAMVAAP
jgi:gamma-glutamyltranspeptidase/glutathione hydrolase